MSSALEMYLCNASGQRLAMLNQANIISMHAQWVANNVSIVDIVLSPSVPYSYLAPYAIIEVFRTSAGGVRSRLFDSKFLVVDYADGIASGVETYSIRAHGGNHIIDGGVVEYDSGSAQASKTGLADDMIKAIAGENFGGSVVDVTRKTYNPPLAIQANAGAAPSVSKDFSRQKILSLFQAICGLSAGHATTPTLLYFDVVWDDGLGSFVLTTYVNQRGTDRSTGLALVRFTLGNRNLSALNLEYDYRSEADYVYAGGQGVGASRDIATSKDIVRLGASPYARREAFIDARNNLLGDLTALQQIADQGLWENRPMRIIDGAIASVPGCEYGTHWFHGDRVVQVTPRGDQFPVLINQVDITWGGGREQIAATLRSVT